MPAIANFLKMQSLSAMLEAGSLHIPPTISCCELSKRTKLSSQILCEKVYMLQQQRRALGP